MKAAVIDLGTNTFHLIIADITASEVNILYKTTVPVRLGQGRINDHLIIPEAFTRGINTLRDFKKEIEKHQVEVSKAVATSAIRSAANGADFVEAARLQAGIDIAVISGDEEAEYIFRGVKATGAIEGATLVMDIGGGSTEFILCDQDTLLWKKSYNIGAARIMQRHFNSDPINLTDQSAINQQLDQELTELKAACDLHQPKQLIGSAGAFETYAAMLTPKIDLDAIKASPINLSEYHKLAELLLTSTHAERAEMPNLIPLRVDMIVIAAILTNYILSTCHIQHLTLSTYDLKMGVLQQLASLER